MTFDQESIFDIVEVLLHSRRASFRDLSTAIDIPYQTLQNYRHSRSKLSAEALFLIANFLQVEIDYLVNFRTTIDLEAMHRALLRTNSQHKVDNKALNDDFVRSVAIQYFDYRNELRGGPNERLLYEKEIIQQLGKERRQKVVNDRLREVIPDNDD